MRPTIMAVALYQKRLNAPGLISPVLTEKCSKLLDEILCDNDMICLNTAGALQLCVV